MKALLAVALAAYVGFLAGQYQAHNAPIPPGWTVKEVR